MFCQFPTLHCYLIQVPDYCRQHILSLSSKQGLSMHFSTLLNISVSRYYRGWCVQCECRICPSSILHVQLPQPTRVVFHCILGTFVLVSESNSLVYKYWGSHSLPFVILSPLGIRSPHISWRNSSPWCGCNIRDFAELSGCTRPRFDRFWPVIRPALTMNLPPYTNVFQCQLTTRTVHS